MNMYRLAAITSATCVTGLLLAACSAGITNVRQAPLPASANGAQSAPFASPANSPAPGPGPGTTIPVNAPIRTFPVPEGAQVIINDSCPRQIGVELGSVTPARAAAFYAKALPGAGYRITSNMEGPDPSTGKSMAAFDVTGHGYSGTITAETDPNEGGSAEPSANGVTSEMPQNVVVIMMSPPGVPDSYACPG